MTELEVLGHALKRRVVSPAQHARTVEEVLVSPGCGCGCNIGQWAPGKAQTPSHKNRGQWLLLTGGLEVCRPQPPSGWEVASPLGFLPSCLSTLALRSEHWEVPIEVGRGFVIASRGVVGFLQRTVTSALMDDTVTMWKGLVLRVGTLWWMERS
jgi:hypothetical protein